MSDLQAHWKDAVRDACEHTMSEAAAEGLIAYVERLEGETMKKLIEENESQTALEGLMGETVLLLCGNYFYHGKIVALSNDEVVLSDARIVYETGPWDEEGFSDAQSLPANVYVKQHAIESYVPI